VEVPRPGHVLRGRLAESLNACSCRSCRSRVALISGWSRTPRRH